MIQLDHKAFFWKEVDAENNPIDPKECQVVFTPKNGGKLLFLEDLNSRFSYEDKKDEIIPILYGQAIGSKQFTLINVKFEIARFGFIGNIELTELEYSIEYIFYDGLINLDKPIEVIHVRYSYLELWLNQVEIKHPIDDKDKTMAGVMVHKEHLQSSSAKYNVLIDINNGFNQNSFNNKSVTYEITNSLAMARKGNFSINEAIELALIIKSFFEIVTFYSENKIFIEEFYITHKRKLKDGFEVNEIVYLLFKQDNYEDEKKMSHLEFLFRYEDIKENFVRVLNNWIENHDKNQNEYSAFCNVIANKNTKFNIYSHCFQLLSALEGYHRLNINSEDIEFRQRLKEIIKLSNIKGLLPLNSNIHKSIANYIYDLRNDIAHSKKSIEINDRVKSSFEYLKLMALLIMFKDIALNENHVSKHILDMNIKHIDNVLRESFMSKEEISICHTFPPFLSDGVE